MANIYICIYIYIPLRTDRDSGKLEQAFEINNLLEYFLQEWLGRVWTVRTRRLGKMKKAWTHSETYIPLPNSG